MPPNFDFVDWWTKESHRGGGTQQVVVSKMENANPNWSMLELESPKTPGFAGEKDKGKNAKQLTWVLLLKAHRAAGCVAWMALGVWTLLQAVKKRLILRQGVPTSDKPPKGKLYKFLTAFLAFAILMLVFEVLAHIMGWHFSRPQFHLPTSFSLQGLLHSIYLTWRYVRISYLAPPLQLLADSCIVLFLIQSADRVIMCLGCLYIKVMHIKPIPMVESFDSEDPEQPNSGYPMVLIQIPMCNEREVRFARTSGSLLMSGRM